MRAAQLFLLVLTLLTAAEHEARQVDGDAEARALVQRLTLDHASAMVAIQKKSDEQQQELFAALDARDRRLRTRERALKLEAQKRVGVESELGTVRAELEVVTRERQQAVDALAAQNRQFAIEIAEFRRQMASLASSPDARKRAALAAYADGDRQRAFAVLVDLQKAEERAVAAGWLGLGLLAIDMNDRGEISSAEVISIYERAQQLNPDQQWGWIELARLYLDGGRLDDAARAATSALKAAADDRSKAVAASSVGVVLWRNGDLDGARRRFEESARTFRALAAAAPADLGAQEDLATIVQRLGDLHSDAGDLAGARRHFLEHLQIARRIARDRPDDLDAQRDVGMSLERVGNVVMEEGDLKGARKHFEEALAVARRAAAARPASAEIQRDVSGALLLLGDTLRHDGDLKGARTRYDESAAALRKLAAADRSNAMAQRDLAVVLGRLGDLALAVRDTATARASFEDALAICPASGRRQPSRHRSPDRRLPHDQQDRRHPGQGG